MTFLLIEIDQNTETLLQHYAEEGEDLGDTAQRLLGSYIPGYQSSYFDEFLDEYRRSFEHFKAEIKDDNKLNNAVLLKLIDDRINSCYHIKNDNFGFKIEENQS